MLELVVIVFIVLVGGSLDNAGRPVAIAPATVAPVTEAPAPVAPPAPAAVVAPAPQDSRTPEPQDPTGKFLTATEVRPILDATKGSWVAVRLYDGQDLLYFTNLLSWRCGLWEIRYGINGAPADQVLTMEPCHPDTAQPAALTDPVGFPIWVNFAPDSVQSVTVEIDYDDGTTDSASFDRNQILIP